MSALFKDRLFIALGSLLVLSLLSWLGLSYLNTGTEILAAAMTSIAFLKVRIIVIHFMELPATPRAIRLMFESWIVLTAGITIGFYLI